MKETVMKQILSPSQEFSPIPFWFFNDEPDRDKIRKQLEDYVAKGVNGLVLHPVLGFREVYNIYQRNTLKQYATSQELPMNSK